ncbi:hypothetical protein BCV69DRAFT_301907 [Microstroma glucosiphilum]|uniref:Uncharacterized protein n=1 Tax=Pseudomicrostroma glucosiphilum TaxID=1684307 RepID=A0A316U465_9BASI|nr:hypothetical protein BCV69DRAFT_301907 [Pseudomicrostroma glucosiphilum]PWN17725.1 hypothetical protein BCV69DRAFT_301907 [Pseudomicrostroma glucosiphilum]
MKRHFSLIFGKKAPPSSIASPTDEPLDSTSPDLKQRHSFHGSPPRLPASDQLSPFKVGFEPSTSVQRGQLSGSEDSSNNAEAQAKGAKEATSDVASRMKQDTLRPDMGRRVRSASVGQQNTSERGRPQMPPQEVQAFNAEILKKAAARKPDWRSPRKIRQEAARARAEQSSQTQPLLRANNGTVRPGRGPAAAGPGAGIHASGRQFSAMSLADRLGLAKESEKEDGPA